MTARRDLRCNERDWTQPIAMRPITKIDILRAASGLSPAIVKRLATTCRESARARMAQANDCKVESLQREHRMIAAELDAAACVLEQIP